MRQGPYELLLVGDGEVTLDEYLFDGVPVAKAEPGQSYHVMVNVYRNESGRFPAKYLRFGLYIDGIDVQYWKRIDLSNEKLLPSDPKQPVCSRFWGFKKNLDSMLSFVFSAPSTSSASDSSSSGSMASLGTIRLVVFEAQVATGVYDNMNGYGEAPGQQNIGESEKFWKQASVTTAAGKALRLEKEKFLPLSRWSNIGTVPLATLQLRYHSSSMIEFLAEFQHRLPGAAAGEHAEGAASGSSVSVTREKCLVVHDLTEDDSGEGEGVGRIVAAAEGECESSSSSKRQRTEEIGAEVQHAGALLPAEGDGALAADDEQDGDREVLIDEEVSYVVRKKVVPLVDFSVDSDPES
jgi:hypothetical protein